MSPYKNPLTEKHCACLDRVLVHAPQVLQLAKDCKDCGLDTDSQIAELEDMIAKARKMRDTFFPGQPALYTGD